MWSPYVPKGYLTKAFDKMSDIDFIINERYTECVEELRELAKNTTNDAGNPFFRALQILEHLR